MFDQGRRIFSHKLRRTTFPESNSDEDVVARLADGEKVSIALLVLNSLHCHSRMDPDALIRYGEIICRVSVDSFEFATFRKVGGCCCKDRTRHGTFIIQGPRTCRFPREYGQVWIYSNDLFLQSEEGLSSFAVKHGCVGIKDSWTCQYFIARGQDQRLINT